MTAETFDLVIRNGKIVDGAGAPAFTGDIAVKGGKIAAIGHVEGTGGTEIDATGKIVTPGFIDVHTHYDGQVTWESRLAPSSNHGVTTVVMGNCGVGFAPVRANHHDLLIKVMEGVEDVPEVVMAEGVPWNWETFPDYLDVIASRSYDVDVATQIPHSPLRVYVMGDRGGQAALPSADECAEMTRLVKEAVFAGALGVSTSRSLGHRLRDGTLAPSIRTVDVELRALARGLREAGAGVFQLINEAGDDPEAQLAVVQAAAEESGRPVSFSLMQTPRRPDHWRALLDGLDTLNDAGHAVRGQVFPRPVGVLMGLDLSLNPFLTRPSYRAIENLPLADKVAIMRDPAFKAKLIAEEAVPDPQPNINMLIGQPEQLFPLTDPVNYAPGVEGTIGHLASAADEPILSYIYDRMLEDDGRAVFCLPGANYVGSTLDAARQMMAHDRTVLALGDGGAHYGMICDASFPTYVLTHWVRDAPVDQRFALEWAIQQLTSVPAATVGLHDRGVLAVGLKADINIIDHNRLTLFAPRVVHNLPSGGRRLRQEAEGYDITIVSGTVTYRNGEPTGALPGKLVRGGGWNGDIARVA